MAYLMYRRASFLMTNGSVFVIRWSVLHYPASMDEPADEESSELRYYIDDKRVQESDLPKGLLSIVDKTIYDRTEEDPRGLYFDDAN